MNKNLSYDLYFFIYLDVFSELFDNLKLIMGKYQSFENKFQKNFNLSSKTQRGS